jgi:hypothetical protein
MTQSNSQGRALEYIILKRILENLEDKKIILTARTEANQKRDSVKFEELNSQDKLQHTLYADRVLMWLKERFNIEKATEIKIDRLSDVDAVAGDVTDINLEIDGEKINLSIKHNHFALKHQRPPTLAVRCGFIPSGIEDKNYRNSLEKIYGNFHKERKNLAPKALDFKDLKNVSPEFINKNLYLPVCELTVNFINSYPLNKNVSSSLFSFLIGNKNFYKVTAIKGTIHIQEYADIPNPISVTAELKGDSYVLLKFSNNWILSLRLHTAKTAITDNPSLKFDTQAIENPIPEEILSK